MNGKLYIVATPIGNLKDISYRAVEVLGSVDLIACEDTRHSMILLNHYGIKKQTVSYHKFNEAGSGENLIEKLKEGLNVAIISDAGMPGISDPGNKIINLARLSGIEYTVIPGACAAINALVLSGCDTSSFAFAGFLPQKNTDRQKYLQNYVNLTCTIVFYAAPHDINKDIKSIYEVFGERQFFAVKEMTKIYENVFSGILSKGITDNIKGEYVLVVEGAKITENPLNDLSVEEHLKYYTDGGLSVMEAVKTVAKERNLTKNDVYKYTMKDKNKE